jgi:hypothetical protein
MGKENPKKFRMPMGSSYRDFLIRTEEFCWVTQVYKRESGFGAVSFRRILVLTAKGRETDAKSERQEEVNHGMLGTHGKRLQEQ